jgi:hypothetical protein
LYDQKAACGKAGAYELAEQFDDAAISVSTTGETKFTVKVTFTSFLMREENVVSATAKPDPPDVLPKRKCLDALAKLRHSKWYQVSCVDSQREKELVSSSNFEIVVSDNVRVLVLSKGQSQRVAVVHDGDQDHA